MTSLSVEPLRRALPADTEREPHDYPIDGLLPRVAFEPGDRQELADLLKAAAREGLVVVPQGARTALALGRPLERYDVALDTSGLRRIVEYVPDDLTVTVGAGLTLRHLQDALAEHGQYLPLDPPPDDDVTVGGLIATARPGAWRSYLPGVRDILIGLTVALPDGSLPRSGGRVVKNVSGYDLHRLSAGALGCFGVIVEASFKLSPLPPATDTLAIHCSDERRAHALAARIRDTPLALRALAVVAPRASAHAGLPHEPHLLLDLAGNAAAVEQSLESIEHLVRGTDARLRRDAGGPWRRLRALAGDPQATVVRAGVPAGAVPEMIGAVRHAGCLAWGFPGSGAVIGHAQDGLETGTVEQLRTRARAQGGFLLIECGSAELRRRIEPVELDDPALVRGIRERLDPGRAINRGRWPGDA